MLILQAFFDIIKCLINFKNTEQLELLKGMKTVNSVADIWEGVLSVLRENLTSVAITTWFSDCSAVNISGNRFILHTPSEFKKRIIESRFTDLIKSALKDIFASDFEVVLLCGDEYERYMEQKKKEEGKQQEQDEYTFENFVVGSSNKFAHAAALAVANGVNKKDYNPLFIYGESGLGKTHLLHAIRHEIKKQHPDYNIVYVKGDDFTNELISAIQTGRNMAFREKYRNADLFLMDDVQFIAGKESTQEEFFHTFNTLYEANRQIVFTSDRQPNEILRLTDRLKTRFESGLLADVQPPDYETRMAIIKNKAIQLGLNLDEDVVNYIAENLTANVRQLEGAVNKIKAYHDLMSEDIDVSSVSKIMKDMFKEKSSFITPDIIIEETAKYFSISPEDIKGPSRAKPFVVARQISMYLLRTLTNFSLSEIGEFFSRDHSTVINSLKQIEKNIKANPDFYRIIKDITSNINSRN